MDELETDLDERRKRAVSEGWLGEIEGIDRTLQCSREKRADALRLTRITRQVNLGMPTVAASRQPESGWIATAPTAVAIQPTVLFAEIGVSGQF
ncbi:hypothetical protein [Saccharopolyspora sp. NPDC050642]|uniref:hypothetical protein n=1 Tax=Saccharopolyspora sp. NPDC050642 TaxID=3157099 RepID=UPI0033E85B61